LRPDGYAIWDTQKYQWFETPNGKKFWSTRGAAANAWNLHYRLNITPRFVKQSRFVTVPVYFQAPEPKPDADDRSY
jgi:hypothetical protein